MPFTMSQSSLPVFITRLNALSSILDQAIDFAASKKIDESVLLQTRLAPDQFPLLRQIQITTDSAKNGSARVASQGSEFHDANEGELLGAPVVEGAVARKIGVTE